MGVESCFFGEKLVQKRKGLYHVKREKGSKSKGRNGELNIVMRIKRI